MSVKTILCYGDSNTWGYDPATTGRFPREKRWPSVLQEKLGSNYQIIAEGLNGRTTVWNDPIEMDKNGATYLAPCLVSHKPLDLVIIMLGTNDLKRRFSLGAYDIAAGACRLAKIARFSETGKNDGAPSVLLVAPPPIMEVGPFSELFAGGAEKSAGFARWFGELAGEEGFPILRAADFLSSSPLDGIHFSEAGQRSLGEALANWVVGNPG